ncbi:MAG: hypothetical protein U0R77_02120 [Mycolicibacterium insubricum]|nr:hypothetical protein [Mycobacterium sp.]
MAESVYLWGRQRTLALHGADLYIHRPGDIPVAVVPVRDISQVAIVPMDEHTLRLLVWFRAPDVVIDGMELHRNPYPVDVDMTRAGEIRDFDHALGSAVLESRRMHAPGPAAPTPGTERTDLTAALAVLAERGGAPGLIARCEPSIRHLLRADETVVAATDTWSDHGTEILVLTTVRSLLVVPDHNYARDVGHDCVRSFEVTVNDSGRPSLKFDTVSGLLFFPVRAREDADRLAEAGNAVLDTLMRDGAVGPLEPTTAELFEAYEFLRERHQLGMLNRDAYGWQLRGVFVSVP